MDGYRETQGSAGRVLQNSHGCRAGAQMAEGALARGQADRGDGHRYGRIRVAGGYANLSAVGIKARTLGGEELSDAKQDRPRPVLYTSRTDGAPAWVHQEDTADARERSEPSCEAAEGG